MKSIKEELEQLASETPNGEAICAECVHVLETLLRKNKAYGDSALSPMRVFSRVDAVEQLRVRIDDKLSRLQRGAVFEHEDTLLDLIGYLILLRIAMKRPGGEAGHAGNGTPEPDRPSPEGLKVRGSMTVVDVDEPETP